MSEFKRGDNHPISKYFNSKEMTCRCGICRDQHMDNNFLVKLDALRDEVGLPISINEGFRCARRQAMLRAQGYETSVGPSSHEIGQAADVQIPKGITKEDFLLIADKYFDNIGQFPSGSLHVDSRPKKLDGSKRRWYYK